MPLSSSFFSFFRLARLDANLPSNDDKTSQKFEAEASRNCGTQIVKLIMSSIHGFFIDVDFLRNNTNRLLSGLSSLAPQRFSRRGRQVKPTFNGSK